MVRWWESVVRPSRKRAGQCETTLEVPFNGRESSVKLRKLDGSLRTQLELPRQPSEGCLLFGSFWSSGTCGTRGPDLVQEEGVKHH